MESSGLNEEFIKNDSRFEQKGVKRGKLSAESIKTFFLESTHVTILNTIKDNALSDSHFPENYLSELQIFLENCYSNNCFSARLEEFLAELSLFKGKELPCVKEKFKSGIESFIDLIDLYTQLESQINQVFAIVQSFPSDDAGLIHLIGSDREFFVAHYTCFVESVIEYRTYLADYVNNYWLYSPVEIQAFIKDYSDKQDTTFEKVLPPDLLEQYKNSSLHLKSCIFNVLQNQQGSPKITFSDLKLSSDIKTSSQAINSSSVCSPLFDTSYTLNDILDQLVEETKHDAVNRGKFVGRELW
ncbi:hypothetical protein [uncultured Nostoc sp.]|uniref:hypothetical protein n=1 Tax=uncultured Nostoc sp. TaxID=340711 RepID=UPI0035C9FE48